MTDVILGQHPHRRQHGSGPAIDFDLADLELARLAKSVGAELDGSWVTLVPVIVAPVGPSPAQAANACLRRCSGWVVRSTWPGKRALIRALDGRRAPR